MDPQEQRNKPQFLRIALCCAALASTSALFLNVPHGHAQTGGVSRVVTLTILPEYSSGKVEVQGSVSPGRLGYDQASLADWGVGDELEIWKTPNASSDQPWNLRGPLENAQVIQPDLRSPDESHSILRLGPYALDSDDKLILLFPFVSIDVEHVSPPPENLADVEQAGPDTLQSLEFSGLDGESLQIDIPYLPVSQEFHLYVTPLLGELFMGREAGFRFSGEVEFASFGAYDEFARHCQVNPADPFFRYREAHNLFGLDFPPAFNMGFLNSAYRFKPNFALLRSELVSCEYRPEGGQIMTVVSGRAFHRPSDAARFPEFLLESDVPERNLIPDGPPSERGSYEIRLGRIRLGEGDRLTLQVPHTDVRRIHPEPNSLQFDVKEGTRIVFEGPREFAISLQYVPKLSMYLEQIPSILRQISLPVERQLGQYLGSGANAATWLCLALGVILVLASRVLRGRGARNVRFVGLTLVGLAFFFGFRGLMGMLAFACLLYINTRRSSEVRAFIPGAATLVLTLLAMVVDTRSRTLFTSLSGLEVDLTPVTPLLLALVGLAAVMLSTRLVTKAEWFSPTNALPFVLFLLALAVYDVAQNSLWAAAVTISGLALLNSHLHSGKTFQERIMEGAAERFKKVWQGRFVPIGLVLIVSVAAANGFASTTAVVSPRFGLLAGLMIPSLLLLSLLLSLTSIGILFILVYPALPSDTPYVKAMVFGFFLWLIFLLGVGGDDRLITSLGSILVGRLVFYLSVPLLISLHEQALARLPASEEGREMDMPLSKRVSKTLRDSFSDMKSLWDTLSAPISILAPAVYSAVFGQPMFSTYFDLLDALIKFSVGLPS